MQFDLIPHPASPPAGPLFKVWATVDYIASLGAASMALGSLAAGAAFPGGVAGADELPDPNAEYEAFQVGATELSTSHPTFDSGAEMRSYYCEDDWFCIWTGPKYTGVGLGFSYGGFWDLTMNDGDTCKWSGSSTNNWKNCASSAHNRLDYATRMYTSTQATGSKLTTAAGIKRERLGDYDNDVESMFTFP